MASLVNRYYDPARGRFTTADPAGADAVDLADPGTWNQYAYVNGDPINFSDPTGLKGVPGPTYSVTKWEVMDRVFNGGGIRTKGKMYPELAAGYGPAEEGGGLSGGGGGQSAVYTAGVLSALAALKDPNCAGIFNTQGTAGYSPTDVLGAMAFGGTPVGAPSGTYFGSIGLARMPLGFSAVTQADPTTSVSTGTGVKALSANILLQDNKQSYGYYGTQTSQDLAITLIHELGHVYNIVNGLGGSQILWDANPDGKANQAAEDANAKTLQKCHPQ